MSSAPWFPFIRVEHHGPENLGNPEEHRVLALAHLVKEITESRSPIIFKPLPQDDPKQRRPDISQAKQLLRWEPKVPIREGLMRTWQDPFRSLIKAAKVVQQHALEFLDALLGVLPWRSLLHKICRTMKSDCRINRNKKHPSQAQLFLDGLDRALT